MNDLELLERFNHIGQQLNIINQRIIDLNKDIISIFGRFSIYDQNVKITETALYDQNVKITETALNVLNQKVDTALASNVLLTSILSQSVGPFKQAFSDIINDDILKQIDQLDNPSLSSHLRLLSDAVHGDHTVSKQGRKALFRLIQGGLENSKVDETE